VEREESIGRARRKCSSFLFSSSSIVFFFFYYILFFNYSTLRCCHYYNLLRYDWFDSSCSTNVTFYRTIYDFMCLFIHLELIIEKNYTITLPVLCYSRIISKIRSMISFSQKTWKNENKEYVSDWIEMKMKRDWRGYYLSIYLLLFH